MGVGGSVLIVTSLNCTTVLPLPWICRPICPSCGADQREDPNPDPIEEMLRSLTKRRRRKKKKVEATSEPETKESFFPDFGDDGDAKTKEDAKTKGDAKDSAS